MIAPFGRILRPPFGPKLAVEEAAGGWWLTGEIPAANCIAAYQPKGADDLADSYINLANPGTYNAAPGTAPTWDVTNGWIFNGSTQYLLTGVIPENDQTWSMIVRFTGASAATCAVAGSLETGTDGRFYIFPRRSSGDDRLYGNGGYLSTGSAVSNGVIAIAGENCYYNSALDGQVSGGWVVTAEDIYIGGINNNGSHANDFDGEVQAFAIYDIDISAYVAGLTTAINAL